MDNDIIVLFSGRGSNLLAIIQKCKHANVRATLTDNPYAPGLKYAGDYEIPTFISKSLENTTREEDCEKIANTLEYFKPKLIVLAGFMKIITPNFFEHFHEKQIINIHPSLLPKYKGLNTHQRVLDGGDEEHGITIHYVTPELDSGPIIWQSSFFIQPDDTAETLEEKVHKLEHQWYPWVIDKIVTNQI